MEVQNPIVFSTGLSSTAHRLVTRRTLRAELPRHLRRTQIVLSATSRSTVGRRSSTPVPLPQKQAERRPRRQLPPPRLLLLMTGWARTEPSGCGTTTQLTTTTTRSTCNSGTSRRQRSGLGRNLRWTGRRSNLRVISASTWRWTSIAPTSIRCV